MINLKWSLNSDNSFINLFDDKHFLPKDSRGVYIIVENSKEYNLNRVLKVGQASNLKYRLSSYSHDEDFLEKCITHDVDTNNIFVTFAELDLIIYLLFKDRIESFLGGYYDPLFSERFPRVASIAVSLPFEQFKEHDNIGDCWIYPNITYSEPIVENFRLSPISCFKPVF